jgi:hypothetical protein
VVLSIKNQAARQSDVGSPLIFKFKDQHRVLKVFDFPLAEKPADVGCIGRDRGHTACVFSPKLGPRLLYLFPPFEADSGGRDVVHDNPIGAFPDSGVFTKGLTPLWFPD